MKQRLLALLICALIMPISTWAALAVGDTFTVDGMTFQVTSVSPNEVQVGAETYAVDKNTEGTVNIPSTVKDSEGKSYSVTAIGKNAFSDRNKITEVQIPATVTSIGDMAFWECTSLTSIVLPEGLTTIGNSFAKCTSLTSINIPSSLTSINGGAFGGCTALTAVHITDMKAWCGIEFSNNTNANPFIVAQHLYLNGNEVKDLIIPEGTTKIGKYAFTTCNSLTSVTIPSGVTDFGDEAFARCEGLTSVTSASSLGERTFYGCNNITNVTLLEGVTSIGKEAFRGWSMDGSVSNLSSITIPSSLKSIGSSAFANCTSLNAVHIKDVASWCGIDFDGEKSNPLTFAHHLFMNGNEVTNLVIPEGVTTIKQYAFSGDEGLTSVTIPSSMTSIERDAFKDCSNLKAVHIKNVASWCGIEFVRNNNYVSSNPLRLAHHLFLNGSEVTDLTIPEGVSTIKDNVFDSCEGLTSVAIVDGVTSIGKRAFYKCTNLAKISIPKSLNNIGSNAFDGCTGLTAVHLSDVGTWCAIPFKQNNSGDNPLKMAGHLFMNGQEVTDLVIPEGVTSISYGAFNGCKFNSVSIPSTLASISDFAFNGVGANTVYIQDLAAWCGIKFGSGPSNPLFGAQHFFVNREEVTNLVIPDGVTEISDYAFYECAALTSVNTGNTVKSIGYYSFTGCDNLNTVTIGKSVTSIDVAFFCCKELKSVTSLIEDPFEIGKNTFTYRETADDPIKAPNATLYVPVGTKAKYEATKGWNSFTNIMEMSNMYTLTYMVDGEEYKKYEIEFGTAITPEEEPVKEGYTFSGWSDIPETMPAENVTVTGSFTINKYTLTYIVDGEEYKSYEIEFGTAITPEEEPVKEGYTFSGWSDIPETMPAENVTVTGSFTQNVEVIDMEPVEDEVDVSANRLDGQNLTNNVIDNVYYNVGDDGYDDSDGSIVISKTTNMGDISNAEPGSEDVKSKFNGVILKVAAGTGTITVNVKTSGNAQLVVQVGNDTPMMASKTEKGDVMFSYNVTENTYVYIYAIIGSSYARNTRSGSDDAVKIYGIKVAPGASGIIDTKREVTGNNEYYTLDGRKLDALPTKKGIYLVNGKKTVVK